MSKGMGRQPMRIAQWNARLLHYNYIGVYKPGDQNKFVDALSKLPLSNTDNADSDDNDIVCNFLSTDDSDLSVSLDELQNATHNDATLQKVWTWITKFLQCTWWAYYFQRIDLTWWTYTCAQYPCIEID